MIRNLVKEDGGIKSGFRLFGGLVCNSRRVYNLEKFMLDSK